jgi:uncharacterized membrane protein YfcA
LIIQIVLFIVLFVIAAGYAAVGLGGGSAYIAALSFWSHDPQIIRPIAWSLNIIAAGIGFINYYRAGHFSWRFSVPLVIGGIGGGAVGARLPIDPATFSWLLAIALFLISIRMFIGRKAGRPDTADRQPFWPVSVVTGFIVGVISGVVGIGGGIILGPIMLAFRLTKVKTSAAMTSLYVALSSAGALAGHFQGGGSVDGYQVAGFGAAVLVGGYLGSRFGARKASPRTLEFIFGTLVLIAAVRLAWISI